MRSSLFAALPAAALLTFIPPALPTDGTAYVDPQSTSQASSQNTPNQQPELRRVAGVDRYETATLLSQENYGTGVAVAYIASGTSYADAVSGAARAAKAEGPLLLTHPDGLPSVLRDELGRLQPTRIVVLGGTGAVSDTVLNALRDYATSDADDAIARLAGSDRYTTSALISAQYPAGVPVVYVATGQDYPDALTAAAAAGRDHVPVLLTQPDELAGATAAELARLRPQRIVVLGGTDAVSAEVAAELRTYATNRGSDALTRIAGDDRYETAAAVAASFPEGLPSAYLASGADFPDALAAGATAGALGVPVLLTRPHQLPDAVRQQLERLRPAEVVTVGGKDAVGDVLTPPPPKGDPHPSAFPDASTTGVPDGVTLTPSGSITVSQDGAVLDSLLIEGRVVIDADDVVIRNSLIRNGGIPVRSNGQNLVIEDSEIDGMGTANPAVAYDDYTLRRVNIHNAAEGPRISGGDVVIEDSYIHSLVQVGNNHTDAIQAVSGDNIRLIGNNVQVYHSASGLIGNAAFQFGEEFGKVHDCLVEGNLFNGGNLTINGGGGGTTGAACTFRHNEFQRDFRYGPAGNLGPNVMWDSSNVWFDTGLPVR